ncbi:hypothetical protein M231_06008 [Tremella mesenterica]|uniref:Cytidyltransferase-like domain-containing protein n=1 Tax=Tremella mesenterica TaxID=5217 RepID=A0A4Q1BGK3_TREME|nr:hypothetical protein M231_06008 [Tremella mesenterica]
MSLSSGHEAQQLSLVLPFTKNLLYDPSPLYPTLYNTFVQAVDIASFTVIFTSPGIEELYDVLQLDARRHWSDFQSFLGKVYATLGAAQWRSRKVLLPVDVLFARSDLLLEQLVNAEGSILVADGVLPDSSPLLTSPRTTRLQLSIPSSTGDSSFGVDSNVEIRPPPPPVVALGGTFDHLHPAHKLLLQSSLFLATRKLIIGITAPSLLVNKSNAALVESLEVRTRNVEEFLRRCGAKIHLRAKEINDPLGPTAWDEDIQALVVSRETVAGGEMVNAKRRENGLGQLELFIVDVIAGPSHLSGPAPTEDAEEGVGIEKTPREGVEGEKEWEEWVKDLSKVVDENQLKQLKMSSTTVRQWIADLQVEGDWKR